MVNFPNLIHLEAHFSYEYEVQLFLLVFLKKYHSLPEQLNDFTLDFSKKLLLSLFLFQL